MVKMPRRRAEVDVAEFTDLVGEAFAAFAQDSSYAVAMAKHATTIQHKREVWQIRLELREATARATALCSGSDVGVCVNPSPCGTGQCAFAQGDLRDLVLPDQPGSTDRPSPSLFPTFSVEQAVRPLQALRAS